MINESTRFVHYKQMQKGHDLFFGRFANDSLLFGWLVVLVGWRVVVEGIAARVVDSQRSRAAECLSSCCRLVWKAALFAARSGRGLVLARENDV